MNLFYNLRQFALICLLAVIPIAGNSQVSSYAFVTEAGTYTPITGGLLLGNTTSDDQRFVDPAVPLGGTITTGVGLPIGFDFTFNGQVYDRVAINNNGWISFGSSLLTPSVNNASSSAYTPISATSTATPAHLRNRIAPFGRDLQAQTGSELRIETIGTAPDQICVIQWTNYKKWGTTGTGDDFNFQIRLYETSNVVEVVYGTMINSATVTTAQVGLGGTLNSDFNNRTTTTDWSNTTAGAVNTATCTNSTTVFPASGTVFRWAVPPPIPPTPTQAAGIPSCVTGTTIDVVGTPPTGVTWYWQTSALGTSTLEAYTGPYTVMGNGVYYLRAFDGATGFWSINSSSITVSDFPTAALPATPVAAANPACITDGTTLSVPAAPFGTEYYWQGTNEFGVSMTDNATTDYPVAVTGTYYIRTFDLGSSCWSDAVGITVTVNSYIPLDPTADPDAFNICISDASALISATNPLVDASLTTTLAGGNGCTNGNMFNITTNANDVTITSFDIVPNTTANQNVSVYYKSGTYVGSETIMGAWTLLGTYNIDGVIGTPINLDVDDFTIPASTVYGIYLNFNAQYTNLATTYSDSYMTVTTGAGLCTAFSGPIAGRTFNGTIHYLIPSNATIEWYDASTGGTSLGTGSPFEAIGTTVMPTSNVAGTYEFYAEATEAGCSSSNRQLVTVTVAPVNVVLTPVAVTCNNGNNGTFTESIPTCGTAPFLYSVDGGPFGPLPTNLTVGDHDIIVQDFFLLESAVYTITIGDALAPSALMVTNFTNDVVDLTWTANGTEAQWNVEWGLPGFVPGTGAEIGSTVVSSNTASISGLDGFTTYDFYVSANCGVGTTAGSWVMVSQITLCDPFVAQSFCESFDSGSMTQDCWTVKNENGDADSWNMDYTVNPFSGDEGVSIFTSLNAGANDDWLISPMLTLTNNEILNFHYRVQSATDPNDFRVMLSTTGMDPADFTVELMALSTYTNITYLDSAIDLSAYSGDCYIAFHVPAGGLDGNRLYIDEVCVDICIPDLGTDGSTDACRLDNTLDLNTVIVPGENNGVWEFTANPGIVSGSDLNLGLLPDGTYDFEYIVTTACTMDTTIATVTVHPASSAGNDGAIDDICTNWSSINLTDALSGSIDFPGTWINVSGEGTLEGSLWTPSETTLAGSYDFQYVVSNGFCPNDTAVVTVTLISCLGLDGEEVVRISVYPNPVTDVLTIQNLSIETGVIEVLDVQGKVVSAVQVNGVYGNYALDMNNIQRGMYIVRITTETSVQEVRVVKH